MKKLNLKEKFDNGVKFVKDHKKEILIGTGVIITGTVVYKLGMNYKAGLKTVVEDNLNEEVIDKCLNTITPKEYIIEMCEATEMTVKEFLDSGFLEEICEDPDDLIEMTEVAKEMLENIAE
jgi:deoxyhypusine synthase